MNKNKNSKWFKWSALPLAGICITASVASFLYFKPTEVAPIDEVENTTKEVEVSSKVRNDPNLSNSLKSFLQSWSVNNKSEINMLITENFNSVTGYYAYASEITKVGKRISIDLGISQVEVPEQSVTVYNGFSDTLSKYKEGDSGLAIVNYNNNKIISVDVYKLEADIKQVQEVLLNTKIETNNLAEEAADKKELKTYKSLTAVDWKGMTLLASRDIISKDMAPIFIVPSTSLNAKKDLTGTFYYIIAGVLKDSSGLGTTLTTYENKSIHLDFGSDGLDTYYGQPVWIHVITQDGKMENMEVQSFEGASIQTMAEGMLGYISSSVVDLDEGVVKDGSKK